MPGSNITVEAKTVSDEDGICEDTGEGYELASITISEELTRPETGPLNADAERTGKLPDSFVEVWSFYGKRLVFTLLMDDWISKDPNLVATLSAIDPSLVEVFPNKRVCGSDGEPRAFTVKVLPASLQLLKAREVKRQVTVDGQHVDVRNGINQEIMQADPDSLNTILVPWWIKNLQDPQSRKRNACERALQKVVALRLRDVSEENLIRIRGLARQPVESIAGEGV